MNEPSPHLAEASDMELATTHSPPYECWHALGASVFAVAIAYSSQNMLLPHRQLDTRALPVGADASAARKAEII